MRPLLLTRPALSLASLHLILCSSLLPLALVAVMSAGYAQAPVAGAVPDDRTISAGRWTVVSVEWDGKPVDPDFLSLLHVIYQADGSWAVLFRSIPVAEGKSTNHQELVPKTFEMETLGSEGIKPSRYTGIYRLDGDIRSLCIAPVGKPRPDEFSAPRRSGRMLVKLRKVTAP